MKKEEEVFQGDSGGVVVNVDKEVCDAAITILVVISGKYSLFFPLTEALVEGEEDFMEDNCSKDK